jgi:hypothetical protein
VNESGDSQRAPAKDCGSGLGDAGTAGRHKSVVELIVRLERLFRSEMPVERRIDMLRRLDFRAIGLVSQLARTVAKPQQSPSARGLSVEQRIHCLMAKNLKRALSDFDRSPTAYSESGGEDRWWLVQHLFLFLGRSIEHSLLWDRPWAPGVWSELHDLFLYLVSRRDVSLGRHREEMDRVFDPETEYKRLLLLGLIPRPVASTERLHELLRLMPPWAGQTALREPAPYDGKFDLCVVEIAKDAPPSETADAVQAGANVWVLEPAAGFLDAVAALPGHLFQSPDPPGPKA